MKVHFFKYQATGNDFVIIDNRKNNNHFTVQQIEQICDRRFGVGADGLMLIESHPTLDFNLIYYNSDGSQSLCGNGSRAAVRMASELGLIKNNNTKFNAYDGEHEAQLLPDGNIRLKMNPVKEVNKASEDWVINTGSPHYIRFVTNVQQTPVVEQGREIRYSETFKPGGINVNFVEKMDNNTIFVRTYERGVENETLSCGTGVTAAALAVSQQGFTSPVHVKVKGGALSVEFKSSQPGSFNDIFLIGPAKLVFQGDLEL